MEEYKMNSLRIKGLTGNVKSSNIYENYNLIENPFPSNPFVSQSNTDKRYNGEIYEEAIRFEEFRQIEEHFLKNPQNDLNHNRIGYIIDTSYVGRGNGKSTFALNLLKKINKNYCLDISDNANKCFGLYIVPETSGRTRTFIQLLDLIAEKIFQSNVINYALAAIRLDAILENNAQALLDDDLSEEELLIDNLNNLKWINSKNIILKEIQNHYSAKIEYNLLSSDNPLRRRSYGHDNSNRILVKNDDFIEYYKQLKKDTDKMNFIFNDLVCIFMMSGFNGSYIIIDDFERIPDFQSDRQKRDFAFELRTSFFDGNSQNAKVGFYNLFLMLHAGVQRLIEKAWSDSGMDQRSPILSASATASHIIPFNKLNGNSAILLIKKYLNEYRVKSCDNLVPFTEDAIVKVGETSEYNASKILKLSNNLIEYAAKHELNQITKDTVESLLQTTTMELQEKTSIVEEQSDDLRSKIDQNG